MLCYQSTTQSKPQHTSAQHSIATCSGRVPGALAQRHTCLARDYREVAELDAALRKLMKPGHGYTHIAFTSKNGIYAVLQRLAHLTGGTLFHFFAEQVTRLRSTPVLASSSLGQRRRQMLSCGCLAVVRARVLGGGSVSCNGSAGSLDDACQVLHDSKASLCALGADGAVLTKAGLAVHVSPREVRQ